jgi:hypothetical protein
MGPCSLQIANVTCIDTGLYLAVDGAGAVGREAQRRHARQPALGDQLCARRRLLRRQRHLQPWSGRGADALPDLWSRYAMTPLATSSRRFADAAIQDEALANLAAEHQVAAAAAQQGSDGGESRE